MKKALQTFSRPGKKRGDKERNEEHDEVEVTPLSVEARVDIAIRSIAEKRSNKAEKSDSTPDSFNSARGSNISSDPGDDSSQVVATSRREFLITEHSNRTLVMDNKRNKSQERPLPDTPWSNRNLAGNGSSRPDYTYYQRSKLQQNTPDESPQKLQVQDQEQRPYEAEYGTLALKGQEDADDGKVGDSDLSPEVVAMAEAADKQKKKNRSSSSSSNRRVSSDHGKSKSNKVNQEAGDDLVANVEKEQRRSRRLSPGLLSRKKGVSPGPMQSPTNGDDGKDAGQVPSEDKADDQEDSPSIGERGLKSNKPARSMSAGALKPVSKPKPRERKAKSQERNTRSTSPGCFAKRTSRPGRKKDLKISGDENEEDVNPEQGPAVAEVDAEALPTMPLSPNASPRRTRGRSPGSLGDVRRAAQPDTESNADHEEASVASNRRLLSRVRSPGTIRRSINMTGEVVRDQSPGALRCSNGFEGHRSRSPRSSRQNRQRSPGRLGMEGSGHVNPKPELVVRRTSTKSEHPHRTNPDIQHKSSEAAPGAVGKIEASPPKRSSSAYRPHPPSALSPRASGHDARTDIAVRPLQHRSRSPRSRRPSTTLRVSQTRKTQSMIVKASDR
jgi:hypothetical protein